MQGTEGSANLGTIGNKTEVMELTPEQNERLRRLGLGIAEGVFRYPDDINAYDQEAARWLCGYVG